MKADLVAEASIEINANASSVWEALVNPEKIKVYLFGTETSTDWKVGSPIAFEGNFNGHVYKDKGNVLEVKENELLRYNYWSSMSGTEDKIENYFIVTYSIAKLEDGKVKLTWHQSGFPTEDRRKHTEQGLPAMLEQIKEISEV